MNETQRRGSREMEAEIRASGVARKGQTGKEFVRVSVCEREREEMRFLLLLNLLTMKSIAVERFAS